MFTIKSYNHVKVSSVIRTMSESKGSSKESFLPGIIRKGSGKLGLTELGDGERMLYWEMEQVGQKFGGVEARRLQGDWSSTVWLSLQECEGQQREIGWEAGEASNIRLKKLVWEQLRASGRQWLAQICATRSEIQDSGISCMRPQ